MAAFSFAMTSFGVPLGAKNPNQPGEVEPLHAGLVGGRDAGDDGGAARATCSQTP